MAGERERVNGNRKGKGCERMGGAAFGTGWMFKVPGDLPGDKSKHYWYHFAGTGWRTGTEARFQPVLKALSLVVYAEAGNNLVLLYHLNLHKM